MDNQNTDKNTENKTKESSQKVKNIDKKKNNFGSLKALFLLTICFLLIAILGVFCIFVGTKDRSLAAMAFDASGNHKFALGSEIIRRNPKIFGGLLGLNLKNDRCESIWNENLINQKPAWAGSFKSYVEIVPNNPDYKNKFSLVADSSFGLNLKEQKSEANISLKANLDFDILQKELGSEIKQDATGQTTLDGSASALLDQSAGYIKIHNLAIKSSDFDSNNSLNNWYKQDYGFDSTQKEGLKEISEVFEEVLKTKPTDLITQKDGESLANTFCKTIDEIKVESLTDLKIGIENKEQSYKVRPIVIKNKDNTNQILVDELPDQAGKIVKNEKFSNYLKNKYQLVQKAAKALGKIQKYSENSGNEEDYKRGVDDLVKQFDKEDLRKGLENQQKEYSDDFKITYEPNVYYLSPENLNLTATKSTINLSFSPNFYKNYKTDEVKKLFAEGFAITSYTYEISKNGEVESVEIPANTKDAKDLAKDLESTPAAAKGKELFYNNSDSSSSFSSNNFFSSPSSSNFNSSQSQSSSSSSRNSSFSSSSQPEFMLN